MKKHHRILLILLVFCLFLWYRDLPEQRIPRRLAEKLDDNLKGSTLLYFTDDHSGFHGDGTTVAVVRLKEDRADAFLASVTRKPFWHPLPIDDTFHRTLECCGIFRDEKGNLLELPTPDRGWYFFFDRHSKSTDPDHYADVFTRSSVNFDLAFYDENEQVLWFFAADT